jgi:uncharacterized protein (DUF983 family)
MQTTAKGPLLTGIRGRCPRCGEGKLFRGFLKLASRCDVCGLNYGFADPADGPAFFAMTAMSFPVVGLALWFDGLCRKFCTRAKRRGRTSEIYAARA